MIEEKDVEVFLKAKKEELAKSILQAISATCLALLLALEALDLNHDYIILLATFSVTFMMAAFGHSRWVTVSRAQLIQTLGNIFSKDADALKILAKKRGRPASGAQAK